MRYTIRYVIPVLIVSIVIFLLYFFIMKGVEDRFESELFPEEGPHLFRAKADRLVLRKEPFSNSPALKEEPVERFAPIHFDQARYRTLTPGRVEVKQSTYLEARRFGKIHSLSVEDYISNKYPSKNYLLKEGAPLEYLQYRAEGACLIRVQQEVYEVEQCPFADLNRGFQRLSDETTELWIRIVNERKEPLGWISANDPSIEELNDPEDIKKYMEDKNN
jgi:hypothetical protein